MTNSVFKWAIDKNSIHYKPFLGKEGTTQWSGKYQTEKKKLRPFLL